MMSEMTINPTRAPMKERMATAWERFRAKGLLDRVEVNSACMYREARGYGIGI
jgi:hypothetical protein